MAELNGVTATSNELLSDVNTGHVEVAKDPMLVATVLEVDAVADSGQQPHADPTAIVRAPSISGPNNPTAQPKRFTTVNITKKFLEKTSSSGTSQTSSSVSAKAGGPISRPVSQPLTAHSRLVTTKLTTAPQASSSPGPGWLRPTSVTPPVASSPSNPNSAVPTTASGPSLPQVGKIIQPQLRLTVNSSSPGGLQKEVSNLGSTKLVWGNVKSAAPMPDLKVQNDFPTAAEVANVSTSFRNPKSSDSKEVNQAAAASRQARMEEADTFRGVHLDPNAHHWDEMEEDDDNFLNSVLEFGDGTQYNIPPPPSSPPVPAPEETVTAPVDYPPVTKEERFEDDFDRSWPRSKQSPAFISQDLATPRHSQDPVSPVLPQLHSSPQETSRVLFNPYGNSYRPQQASYPRKGSTTHSDSTVHSADARSPRETSHGHNVNVLQKHHSGGTGHDYPPPRGGNFSPALPGSFSSHRPRDKDVTGHENLSHPPFDPKRTRDKYTSFGAPPSQGPRERESHAGEARGRRLSNTGLPIRNGPREDEGSYQAPSSPSGSRRAPSLDHSSSLQPPSSAMRSISPTHSRTSAASPMADLAFPGVDLEEVRRDVMQNAAGRARLRRQQEEEERTKAQERARKKAAELEAKMKDTDEKAKAKETAVNPEVKEGGVGNTLPPKSDSAASQASRPHAPTSPLRRPPSLRGTQRSTTLDSSPASQAESWRSRSIPSPISQRHPRPLSPPVSPRPAKTLPKLPDALDHIQTVPNEELEVVDFTEFGKFAGGEEPPAPNGVVPTAATENISSHRAAPSGALSQSSTGEKTSAAASGSSSWRKNSIVSRDHAKLSEAVDHGPQAHHTVHLDSRKLDSETAPPSGKESTPPVASISSSTEAPLSTDHGPPPQRAFSNQGHPRSQRPSFYKEPAMSALDDAMSRIKGAMQSSDHARERRTSFSVDGERQSTRHSYNAPSARFPPPGESRWVPPALRALRQQDPDLRRPDPPDVLSCEPSIIEPGDPVTRLPLMSNALEPPNKRQFQMFKAPPAPFRLDMLCWEPPVELLSRRTLSINDVLFGRPFSDKGRGWKYKVVLPRPMYYTGSSLHIPEAEGPRVNLPLNGTTRFPKSAGRVGAASSGTWRRPPSSPSLEEARTLFKESGLNTTSRSPPPETPSTLEQEKPAPKGDVALIPTQRLRSPPKMPEGSGVAFYRGSRIDSLPADSHTLVNFIVGSELDDATDLQTKGEALQVVSPAPNSRAEPVSIKGSTSDVNHTGDPIASDIRSQPPSPESAVASLPNATGRKGFDEPVGLAPTTPPLANKGAWTKSNFPIKESPSRLPNPEHLKAVWDQASDKARGPIGNSLEGIADDLTTLPFNMQDVKCDDGETPPSLPAAPSRMSLHDVTRAFQQVPSSSSSSPSQRGDVFTQSATNLALAPPNYTYALPPPPPNMAVRSPYASYASPVMASSPSPTAIYAHAMTPSPVPTRMPLSTHAPVYNHWMPPGPTPPMYRPMLSSYPPQLVSFASTNGPTALYAPPPHAPQTPVQAVGVQQSRGRGMPVISPMIQPSNQHVYPGSPVMVHPQNHNFMPVAATTRGQIRTDHIPAPPQIQPTPTGHPQTVGFNTVHPTPFGRPTW